MYKKWRSSSNPYNILQISMKYQLKSQAYPWIYLTVHAYEMHKCQVEGLRDAHAHWGGEDKNILKNGADHGAC